MKARFLPYILSILAIVSSFTIKAEDFIFDLGGVLFDTNKRASLQHMGMINIAQCSFYLKINPLKISDHIKTTLFATLDKTAILNGFGTHNTHLAYDETGNLLPYLMRAWLQGTMSCDQIRILLNNAILLHPEWFNHAAEQRIIENLIRMIFTPEQFVTTRKIYTAGVSFVKKCKRLGHRVYALSNWDSESFELLKKRYPELFDLFDGIIISGNSNALKPNPTIYQVLLTRYELDPEHCWFIDDQQENITAAQELGINAILHTSCFKKLTQNIRNAAHSKSVARRAELKKSGISVNNTKNTSSAMIDGENISLTDSTKYNCLPANA